MHILDLPQEVLLELLAAAAIARGISRALRLRLVCKIFASAVEDAILQTDIIEVTAVNKRWFRGYQYRNGATAMWDRCMRVRMFSPNGRELNGIAACKRAAAAYCRLAGKAEADDLHQVMEAMCTHKLLNGPVLCTSTPSVKRWDESHDQQGALLAALCSDDTSFALALMDTMALADRSAQISTMGKKTLCPFATYGHDFFGLACPVTVALSFKHFDVLAALVRAGVSARSECVTRAVHLDLTVEDVDTVVRIWGKMGPGNEPHGWPFFEKLAVWTPSLLVFNMVHGSRSSDFWDTWDPSDTSNDALDKKACLVTHAALGDTEIVGHMLRKGYPRFSKLNYDVDPLSAAAGRRQTDMVRFLLTLGADVEHQVTEMIDRIGSTALGRAAQAGSLEIVRLLLDRLEESHDWVTHAYQLVVNAIANEDVAMFDLFRRRGLLTARAWALAHGQATDLGLESMMDLLKRSEPGTYARTG